MTRKQWIVLVLLLITALVPIFNSGSRPKKTAAKKTPQVADDNQTQGLREDSRSALTDDPNLVARADRALTKLSTLASLGPAEEKRSADDILKGTQFLSLDSSEVASSADPIATVAPQAVIEQPTVSPPAFSDESSTTSSVASQKISKEMDSNAAEKLQLKIASLESKLDEQRRSFESRTSDLKSKLDIQESENVKLSHQIQSAENNSADAGKLSSKIKDLELKLEKSQAALLGEKKRVDDSKALRADYGKRLAEEQKIRKSIEDQLELAVKKRDEQAKDNDKLRRVVGDFEKRVKLIEEQRMALSEDKEQVLLKQLASLRKELTTAQGALDDLKKKQKAQSSDVTSAMSKVEELQKQLDNRQRENDELSVRLATAERINEGSKGLQQELLAARNELMLAQEQVRTLMSTSKTPNLDYQNRSYQRTETIQPPKPERPSVNSQTTVVTPSSDYLTVEVTAQKAALRAGAGEENSTVMEIQQGSRLMVETREGDWYRVITPKGQRAYLRADLAVELDASGRPRFSNPPVKTVKPGPRPARTLNPNPPDSDPLVELLGRQLKDRIKPAPSGDESLNVDDSVSPPPVAPTGANGPTSAANPEDEMEAFEALKQGMKKE